MDAALSFSLGNTLNTMRTGFKLELLINILAFDTDNYFLITAVFALTLVNNLELPTLQFCITGIHAQQVSGKYRCLIATCARADFNKDVEPIFAVLGQ